MKLKVTVEYDDSGYRPGYKLSVHHNGELIEFHEDNGEPEDNLFVRDYDWIKPALEKVYELGYLDAMKERFPLP